VFCQQPLRTAKLCVFRKNDVYLVALLSKMICNLGDPMSPRHPVLICVLWRIDPYTSFPAKEPYNWSIKVRDPMSLRHPVSSNTHINESCHTHEYVTSHRSTSHVTHMNTSCHMYQWVMSHTWIRHVTCINESCHTHSEWCKTLTLPWRCHTREWVSHVTPESCSS